MTLKLQFLLVIFFSLITNINAQQGKLDTTFNTYDNGLSGDGFNNTVRTLAMQTDGNLIVGGDFLSFNGKPLSYLTRLKTDGTIDEDFNTGSGFNGKVYSSHIQEDGKIIVGGNFTSYNGVVSGRLIRLNTDGSQDITFNTSIAAGTGIVNQITQQPDGKIILVGSFTKYNGITVNRIARILPDGNLDPDFLTGSGALTNINCVQIQSDGKIIVAGSFIKFNGVDINRIIRLNPDGSLDLTFHVGSAFNEEIHTMVLQPDGKIILGGEFTDYNGSVANRIIRLNPDGTMDSGFLSGTGFNNGSVYILKIDAFGNIMVGGSFTDLYNEMEVNRLILLNSDGTVKPDFDTGAGPGSASVYSLENSTDGAWYIGGSFSVFDSQNQGKLAKTDANGIHDMSYLSAGVGFDNSVLKIVPLSDDKIMVFGNFSKFNGMPSAKIARILPNGDLDNTFNSAQSGANNAIKTATQQLDGKMIIAGSFTSYNNTICNRIARILADGSIDNSFISGSGFNGQVFSVAIQSDQKILAVGNFTKYNSITSGRIVRLMPDGTIDLSFNTATGANGIIDAIVVQSDGKIILGGRFDTFNGIPYSRLIRLNADGSVDNSFSVGIGFDKNVYALDLQSDGKIIVGGSFLNYNGVSKKRILRLNSDGSLDETFNSGTGFSNGDVRNVLVQPDDRILIGGSFSGNYNGIASLRLLRLSSGGVLDSSFSVNLNSTLYTMAFMADDKLIIGGNFNSVSGITKHRIARLKLCNNSSKWNGSDWSNGLPSAGKELTFEEDYVFSNSVNACSCSINSAKTVTISSGKTLGLSFNYSGSGILVLEDTASLYQSDDEMVNTGIIYLKRKTTPIRKFDYTYWSSPVENQKLIDVSPTTLPDKFFSFNPDVNYWAEEISAAPMTIARGYIIRGPQEFSTTAPEKYEAVFKGIPNNGKIKTPIGIADSFNLIGNPYPSALDADVFLEANSDSIKGTLYFWTHNTPLTNNKYASADYAVYNLLGGVGTTQAQASGENKTLPDGKIASAQSFFIQSAIAGEVKFENSMRIIEQNSSFFKPAKSTKKNKTVEKSRIWLNLTNEENAFKQLLIGYIEGATNGYDLAFDGESFNGNKYIDFYSFNEEKNWAIQGREFPFKDSDEVALGYKTEINGKFTISIDHLDKILAGQSVYIEDKDKMILHDLKKEPYIFSTEKGIFNNRFVLKFSHKTLNTIEVFKNSKDIMIYQEKGNLIIESDDSTIQKIQVYDSSGKLILEQNTNQNSITISNLKQKNQLLILKIKTENALNTEKIIY
ncbi:calcium-binding protein [Flavobacterium cheongpyeongense]|uniref:Calcium-binding protein n=1 Tax=Flavobacterium cheongpyeongense TaxID=2212651 RepID=A0A2V4BMX6_9FLAO|nr:calcium-binding protein [Flavobacterium cheongpyeongense]PXY40355.1 calcium-binding protein [Flavobacterium cheongpyeongense]